LVDTHRVHRRIEDKLGAVTRDRQGPGSSLLVRAQSGTRPRGLEPDTLERLIEHDSTIGPGPARRCRAERSVWPATHMRPIKQSSRRTATRSVSLSRTVTVSDELSATGETPMAAVGETLMAVHMKEQRYSHPGAARPGDGHLVRDPADLMIAPHHMTEGTCPLVSRRRRPASARPTGTAST
jgi:hypothetical protein